MTVRELISALGAMPPDALVRFVTGAGLDAGLHQVVLERCYCDAPHAGTCREVRSPRPKHGRFCSLCRRQLMPRTWCVHDHAEGGPGVLHDSNGPIESGKITS